MTTSVYRVLVNGQPRGFHAYQNCADVWFSNTGVTRECAYAGLGNQCACRDKGYPEQVAVLTDVYEGDPSDGYETFELRWCDECRAVVPPPFDGYVYHEYECDGWRDGERCTCKERL